MSQTQELRQHAAAAQKLAQAATLANIRSRYLESAAVWDRLAERAERLEQMQSCEADW